MHGTSFANSLQSEPFRRQSGEELGGLYCSSEPYVGSLVAFDNEGLLANDLHALASYPLSNVKTSFLLWT